VLPEERRGSDVVFEGWVEADRYARIEAGSDPGLIPLDHEAPGGELLVMDEIAVGQHREGAGVL
jgi:hypothetical protein